MTLLAALAGVACAASLVGPSPASATGRNCARPGTVTLAATSGARIFRPIGSKDYELFGCLKSRDHGYRLDHNTGTARTWTFGRIPLGWDGPFRPAGIRTWYFSGRFAGVWAANRFGTELWIYSLRSGRMAVRIDGDFRLGAPEGEVTAGPLLATNGVPVWTAAVGDEGMRNDFLLACMDAGVKAWNRPCRPESTGPHFTPVILDGLNVKSLSVSGATARWTKSGAPRSRSLVPLGY